MLLLDLFTRYNDIESYITRSELLTNIHNWGGTVNLEENEVDVV